MNRKTRFMGMLPDNVTIVSGDLIHKGDQYFIVKEDPDTEKLSYFEVMPHSVCEYTGKRDCKKNKIFEGHLVRYSNSSVCEEIGVVRWGKKRAGFCIEHRYLEHPTGTEKVKYYSLPQNSDDIEILGHFLTHPYKYGGRYEDVRVQ